MYEYILLFLIFGIAGWALDSAYRSITERKFSTNTYLHFFAISYAIAGTLLVLLFKHTTFSFPTQIILGGIGGTIIELIAGIFCEKILGKRYWNYSENLLNFHGHIDLLHTIYWFALAALVHALITRL